MLNTNNGTLDHREHNFQDARLYAQLGSGVIQLCIALCRRFKFVVAVVAAWLASGDAVGLMLIVSFLGLLLTPLILALSLPSSEVGLEIDTLKIRQTLLTAQLIPLSVGMTIRHVRPRWL